jgi:hypothetical protein
MAKIHEEIVLIKLSKLVKETDGPTTVANDDLLAALGVVAEELAGAGIIVEVEKA